MKRIEIGDNLALVLVMMLMLGGCVTCNYHDNQVIINGQNKVQEVAP